MHQQLHLMQLLKRNKKHKNLLQENEFFRFEHSLS
jgi:hypothetical protein